MTSHSSELSFAGMEGEEKLPKPVHTLLLDTTPILLNTPPISTILSNCELLVVTPSVISEIKGEEAKRRFDTLYRPFVNVRSPKPESVKFVSDFARRTGDLTVLSAIDLEVLALAYDLECERNGGNWRLRTVPGQKRLNGRPPQKQSSEKEEIEGLLHTNVGNSVESTAISQRIENLSLDQQPQHQTEEGSKFSETKAVEVTEGTESPQNTNVHEDDIEVTHKKEETISDSDEGWITPSNIKRHQANDEVAANSKELSQGKVLQVATMTGDFAIQNVLLQMNLNLVSTKTCKRIGHIKQMVFRCHACFMTTKDMTKQFCPRCGKPTLTRVTCTTNDKGEVKLHLKSDFQWNNRGNVYSVPKPVSGSANQKWQGSKHGGGKGGWGSDLILAEDQKEYVRALSQTQRKKQKDLMDEDVLPSILTGDRDRNVGRIKVGAGRNVNKIKR